jgi:hypothetical protein
VPLAGYSAEQLPASVISQLQQLLQRGSDFCEEFYVFQHSIEVLLDRNSLMDWQPVATTYIVTPPYEDRQPPFEPTNIPPRMAASTVDDSASDGERPRSWVNVDSDARADGSRSLAPAEADAHGPNQGPARAIGDENREAVGHSAPASEDDVMS